MDKQPSTSSRRRPNFPLEFKISLVEQSLQPGVSIAQLARANGINDNLLFNWRQLYRQGKFGVQPKVGPVETPALLAVTVTDGPLSQLPPQQPLSFVEDCSCEIEFASARLRLSGNVTPALLRTLIQEIKGSQP